MATLIRTDRNGTKYYSGMVNCDRCGGFGGADKWAYTGWKCYKCGGSGKIPGTWKEYTPEYEAKLKARREARAEKMRPIWEAQAAKIRAEQEAKEAARKAAEEERAQKIAEEKAKSRYVGQVGERIETKAVLKKHISIEVPSYTGFGTTFIGIYIFKAGDNTLVWKTETGMYMEEGEEKTIKATVKAHEEYNGEKQTKLIRVKAV